jgi:hypothetical protein
MYKKSFKLASPFTRSGLDNAAICWPGVFWAMQLDLSWIVAVDDYQFGDMK